MLIVRLALFVSSFSLAVGVAGVRLIGRDDVLALLFGLAAIVAVVPAAMIGRYAADGGDFNGTVDDFYPRGEAVAGYLVSYLLPVIVLEPRASSDVAAVVVFLVALSVVYTRADLHYLNPLLPLLGYRIWELTVEAPDRCHRFVAITQSRGITFGARVSVIGDGPVRLVRVLKTDEPRDG